MDGHDRPRFISKIERQRIREIQEQQQKKQQQLDQEQKVEIRREYEKYREQKQKQRSRSRSKEREQRKNEEQLYKEQIREQYLGQKQQKQEQKERQRNVLRFQWDDSEDTSIQIKGILQRNDRHNSNQIMNNGEDRKGKKIEQMTERDWRIFREDNQIIIKGGKVIQPIRKWNDLKPMIDIEIYQKLVKLYSKPTGIQMQGIPIGLQNKDMIGLAPTGSGKSLAFLVPCLQYLLQKERLNEMSAKDGPYGLIMIPTRELAIQIHSEFTKLCTSSSNRNSQLGSIRSQVIIGGKWIQEQGVQLSQGCELVIGTPGRIKDAFQEMYLAFNQCSWVVLDEADKMIELGFEEDVKFILQQVNTYQKNDQQRVTHLYSATMPTNVERLAKQYLRQYCYISIGDPGSAKKEIDQIVEFIQDGGKRHRLQQIFRDNGNSNRRMIIFMNNRTGVDTINSYLENQGYKTITYHGGKNQQKREEAISRFRSNKVNIMVATDLAGRGLDIDNVELVINYDCPKSIYDFIHRTGRTGRASNKGKAYTFITSSNTDIFYDLKDFLIKNNYHVPEELANHQATKVKPGSIEILPRRKQVLYCQ